MFPVVVPFEPRATAVALRVIFEESGARVVEAARVTEVVAAAGVAHMITADSVKPGAAVLDVGITRTDAGLLGDVHPSVRDVAGFVAPMPGGTGPMTRAMLLANVVDSATRSLG